MAFLTLFLCGLAGGLLGGMGMGGGTALIPLLTLFGVGQAAAQGINLVSFLPMAAFALPVHAKSGLLKGEGLLPLALSALAFSALTALLAAHLPSDVLERGFGVFLIALALVRLRAVFRKRPRGAEFFEKTAQVSCVFGEKGGKLRIFCRKNENFLQKGMDKPLCVW